MGFFGKVVVFLEFVFGYSDYLLVVDELSWVSGYNAVDGFSLVFIGSINQSFVLPTDELFCCL